MKKFRKLDILKNVGSSWFQLAFNVAVGIFLSPYILHHLGDEAFGLWVLIFSLTGYYGLFDLGIRSSVIRYVSKYTATEDYTELNRLVSTATFTYSGVGLLCLCLTVLGASYVDHVFRVPASFLGTARMLFLMVGTSVAIGFPLGVFGGILEGLQRFYLLNFTGVVQTLLRAILIVIALQHGRGLLTVALITVALPLVGGVVNGIVVMYIIPLQFRYDHVDYNSLRKIAGYSASTFMIMVAGRLRFKTDAMVIGTFLSSAAITYFAIGSRLVDYAGDVVSSLAQIFLPMSSQVEAAGDTTGLRKMLVAGNRACALIIFPIAATLSILGPSIIEAWVGAKYVRTSYPVLLILLIPSTLMLAQAASGRILWGLGKHRTWAYITLLEGVANLTLSIVLVRRYGVLGDAVGTAIPLTCTMLFFLPHHVCHLLDMRLRTFLSRAYLFPLALSVPLVVTLLWMRHWFIPHNYSQLALQLLIAGMVYGTSLLWAFWTGRAWKVGELPTKTPAPGLAVSMVETYQEEV